MKAQDTRSLEELLNYVAAGGRPKYEFFWGHRPRVPGRVDKSCFSQWFPAPFVVDGVSYPTTEHFMMAEKARLFGDEKIRAEILATGSPGGAKSLGRKVSAFDDTVWKPERFEIVVRGNMAKFSQDEALKNFLRITGSKVLVEASPADRIWGIGMDLSDERATKPAQWNGLNLLGFALMEVRERLLRPAS